ncbi:hypothetical protein K7432_017829, partial [Basidiobolus ranarum]
MKFFTSRSLFLLASLQVITALPHYGTGGGKSGDYCNGLVARLNVLGAKLNANVCVGKSRNSGYSSSDVEKLNCNGLVLAVEALGIKIKAGLCSKGGNGSGGTHNGGYKTGGGGGGNYDDDYDQGYGNNHGGSGGNGGSG